MESRCPNVPHEPEVEIVKDLQRESRLRLNTEAQVDLAEAASAATWRG